MGAGIANDCLIALERMLAVHLPPQKGIELMQVEAASVSAVKALLQGHPTSRLACWCKAGCSVLCLLALARHTDGCDCQ